MSDLSIDDLDLCLLDALQTDASQSLQVLAAQCGVSAPTVLRRLRRLEAAGVIERRVAILQPQRLAAALGEGLTAIVEIGLDHQGEEHLRAFEARAVTEPAVQQCYRVSAGPDFVLVVAVRSMADYHALAQRLWTEQGNVRQVKAYFSIRRAKFDPRLPLPRHKGADKRPVAGV
ncbi:DNA-binding transcriptional activator DecR [Tepidimonas thermarum]|uniref:DNA-binding transcriptional activator DecR n=1 Tax=Tepidimonas thermarum TaxID=335431 RepID=A0A554X2I9_9BURK|nr:Lrp/AsnC family transcriptional regulator [Tepidimonas thermarum]TSE30037.1 DNA-binding transcriptional activator DecR [Tepidimonas thermarum]